MKKVIAVLGLVFLFVGDVNAGTIRDRIAARREAKALGSCGTAQNASCGTVNTVGSVSTPVVSQPASQPPITIQQSGGCANGSCSQPAVRRGIFR